MSYNIDSSEYLSGQLSILVGDFRRFAEDGDLPECTFLNEGKQPSPEAAPDDVFPIEKFWWSGEWSGHTYEDLLIKQICPVLIGSAEVVFTWEGGDSFTGLRIKDGAVTECDVIQKLVPKKVQS